MIYFYKTKLQSQNMAFNKYTLLDILRSCDELSKFMTIGGYVEWETFKKFTDTKIDPEEFIDGKFVIENKTKEGKRFVKASYAHTGRIADFVNYGQYARYDGPYKIFCFTHTTVDGLGMINFKRTLNILNVPERCENKGVRAFVNIDDAKKHGIEFWSPIGDRYKNKIFCFDPKLREYCFRFEYVDDYSSEKRLLTTHINYINFYKENMKEGDDDTKTKIALSRVKSLIILDESSSEEDSDDDISLNISSLKI